MNQLIIADKIIKKKQIKREEKWNGYAIIKFAAAGQANLEYKMNQGFRLGKCFQLYYANVTEIRGKLENDHLKVCQKLRKISISKCII